MSFVGLTTMFFHSAGILTSVTAAPLSMAEMFIETISSPLRPNVFFTAVFMAVSASSYGITPEILKNAACRMVLVRLPKPISSAILVALMMKNLISFSAMYFFMESGKRFLLSSESQMLLSRKVPPFFKPFNRSYLLRYAGTWHATKSGVFTRYGERIGLSPKRRCDVVIPPDFFESYAK